MKRREFVLKSSLLSTSILFPMSISSCNNNPSKTKFLEKAEKLGNRILNGKMMFIYQAQLSFKIWHDVLPKVNDKVIKILN